MPVIPLLNEPAQHISHVLVKRHSWAYKEPGVILIFCILGALGIAGLAAWIYKRRQNSKEDKV